MEFTEKHFTPSRGFGDGRKAHRSAVALAKPGCGTVDWHVGSENSSRLEIVDLHVVGSALVYDDRGDFYRNTGPIGSVSTTS